MRVVNSLRIWRGHLPKSMRLLWSVLAATLVMAIAVGFFLRGGVHGLYSDDYTHKAWAFDFSAARWRLNLNPIIPSWRPVHTILTPNLANAIPEHEFPVRLGIVAVHLLNVFLLATLAYRLTGSILVAVLSGELFLIPVFANEALLFFSAIIPHVIPLSFLLVGFHLALSCHSVKQDVLLLAGALIVWFLMILSGEAGYFTPLLLPVFIGMRRHHGERASPMVWILVLAASYVFLGLYLLRLVQTASSLITDRGGLTLDPTFILLHRIPDVTRQLSWFLTDWGYRGPLREALRLGLHEWISVPTGWIILVGLLMGLSLVPITHPANQQTMPSRLQAFTLVLAGMAWVGLALLPIVLLKSQFVLIRALYTPMAGLALGVAGFFCWIVGPPPRPMAQSGDTGGPASVQCHCVCQQSDHGRPGEDLSVAMGTRPKATGSIPGSNSCFAQL